MLHSVRELRDYALDAADATVGSVKDVLFDDERRTVRHLVAETGDLLTGRRVLIPPPGIVRVDHANRTVRVWMTRQQIADAPSIDEDRPVSRQHEASVYLHWGYPLYWTGPYQWDSGSMAGAPSGAPTLMAPLDRPADDAAGTTGDPHLRSAREVIGYRVAASDGELGHVEDLIIEDDDWSLREVAIGMRDGVLSRTVRVAAQALDRIDRTERIVFVRMARRELEDRPGVVA